MSQCVRSVSNRLITCVNSKKRLVQFDHSRLTKHTKRCAILEKYSTTSPVVEETTANLLPPRFLTSINNTSLRLYSTAATNPKETVVVQSNDKPTESVQDEEKRTGPSQEQLQHIFDTLNNDLPNVFVAPIDYRIYHRDLEFINNLKGMKTKGLNNYIKQVLFLRTTAHLAYAYVKFDILKITINPEDNAIKVRWRIRGLSSLKVFTMFWKLKLLKMAEATSGLETWHDGFSTFHVGADGLVYKHVADKMMPDDETIPDKAKTGMAAKLAA